MRHKGHCHFKLWRQEGKFNIQGKGWRLRPTFDPLSEENHKSDNVIFALSFIGHSGALQIFQCYKAQQGQSE